MGNERVAAIIPAYNEEKTIGGVIDAVRRSRVVDEIIVVSDGSTDGTAQVARARGARVLELKRNLGKGGAMKVGFDHCTADIILFLDADLVGLRSSQVRELLRPVQEGVAPMTLGVFAGGRVATDLAQAVAPFLSGQRAVRREVLESIPDLELARFGVEIALTRHIRKTGLSVHKVPLRYVTHRMKEEKLGLVKGLAARARMYWEIMRILPKD